MQNLMRAATWIWCEDDEPNVYCQARGRLHLPAAAVDALIHIVADSRYQLWVNGKYTGQGPTPFKRPNVFVDSYDVSACLRTGANVIAVLVAYHGVKHCTYTPGMPGILAHLRVIDADGKEHLLVTDLSWTALASRAYTRIVPRRTWATAWCEYYDARLAEPGWEQPDYDDSSWPPARPNTPSPVRFLPRMAAPLTEYPVDAAGIAGIWSAEKGIPAAPVEAAQQNAERRSPVLTAYLDEEPLEPLPDTAETELFHSMANDGCLPLKLRAADRGLAVTVDFGREIAGQVELDIEAPAGTVVDLCPAELLREGRPWCFRKEGDYAKRYITRDGRQQWRGFGFDGFRYLHAVVRGPHAALTLHRLGAWRRESDLPIRAAFACDSPVVERIWDITCHTARICSQDIHIDCPTREQTSAWGDSVWTGVWAAYLTGDASALRHLMLSAEHVQLDDGQMPCYAFSETHGFPMFDYSLICVVGIWQYLLVSGDRALAARLIPVADRILDWYRKKIWTTGLIELDCDEAFRAGKGLVFVDHSGLGWHNCPHPGLDRRGINAALNFFFIQSVEAEANVLAHIGQRRKESLLRKEADRMRAAAESLFWDPAENAYADGYSQGRRSAQISQQTNALAVISGVCPSARAPQVLARVLDADDAGLCRCGTYFWLYMAEALCRSGMHETMWREVIGLWDGMARQGATTWWETFLGDEMDSLCHFWSCVPGYLIQSEILGIKPAEPGFARIAVSPRFDLLEKAEGSVPLPDGEVRIEWQTHSERECHLRADLSTAGAGILRLPQGWVTADDETSEVRLPPHSSILVRAKRREADLPSSRATR